MKTDILGVWIDKITPQEALEKALEFSKGNEPHVIFTPNPEFIMTARKDKKFKDILNAADLLVPDGIGVVLASKLFNKVKIKYRVTGYDLVQEIFKNISKSGESVYFLGGAPGVAETAREKMQELHNGLKVVGVSDGYFDEVKEIEIIKEIIDKKPDILLLGIGFPKQEKWIDKHKNELPVKLHIGIGGALDGMAGIVPRAPKFFRKCGLEWLYRLIRQPSRWKRQLQLPLFILVVTKEKIVGLFKRR